MTSRRSARSWRAICERAGFQTGVALDGPQAIAMSAEHRPDLVILDIMLPGIDGLEVMRRLHESEHARPAVILLTAKGEESDRIVGPAPRRR